MSETTLTRATLEALLDDCGASVEVFAALNAHIEAAVADASADLRAENKALKEALGAGYHSHRIDGVKSGPPELASWRPNEHMHRLDPLCQQWLGPASNEPGHTHVLNTRGTPG